MIYFPVLSVGFHHQHPAPDPNQRGGLDTAPPRRLGKETGTQRAEGEPGEWGWAGAHHGNSRPLPARCSQTLTVITQSRPGGDQFFLRKERERRPQAGVRGSVVLTPTRSRPLVTPAFLCKRPNLLRTSLNEHRMSFPIEDRPVRVRVRVRRNLWEITPRSDPGCHPQHHHAPVLLANPPPHAHPRSAACFLGSEAYAPPLLYLFID